MSPHDARLGMGVGGKQQMADFMCHGKTQNSRRIFQEPLFLDQLFHTVVEDVYQMARVVFGPRCDTEYMSHVGQTLFQGFCHCLREDEDPQLESRGRCRW